MKIKKIVLFLAILSFSVLLLSKGHARTFAYLVGTNGEVAKMDAETDTIISSQELQNSGNLIQTGETSVVSDQKNNRLYIVAGRKGSTVLIYELKTLKFVKDLGITTPEPDVTILAAPDGSRVFVIWFNPALEGGAWQFDVYDGAATNRIKTLEYYFYPKQATFSKDSSTLYAIEGGDSASVKIIDMATLRITSTIDLNSVWRTDVFAHAVVDCENEFLLIGENEKTQSSPSSYTLFVYDLKNRSSSKRIKTGMTGKARLLQALGKISFDETENVFGEGGSYIKFKRSPGRFHIYDVVTGSEIGVIKYSVDRESDIIGVRPNGTKVYLIGTIQGVKSLIVLDVKNYRVTRSVKIPENTVYMIFWSD